MPEPTSARWRAATLASVHPVASLRVFDSEGGVLLDASPWGDPTLVEGFDVTEDWSDEVVTTGAAAFVAEPGSALHDLLVVPSSLAPFSPLADTWWELRAGFMLDGVPELVPLGYLQVDDHTIEHSSARGVVARVSLADPGQLMAESRFYGALSIASGTDTLEAGETLVRDVLGDDWPIERNPCVDTTGRVELGENDNRLAVARRVVASAAHQLRWNRGTGAAQLQPQRTTYTEEDWTYEPGAYSVLDSVRASTRDRNVYSGVVVRGEQPNGDDDPVEATAWDLDPNSATYYNPADPDGSRVGPRPYRFTSKFIRTEAQALRVAMARLPKVTGLPQQVEVEVAWNPAVVPGDLARIIDDGSGVSGVFEIERRTLGSDGHGMRLRCAERRLGITQESP